MDRRRLAKRSLSAAATVSLLLIAGTTYVAHAIVTEQTVSGLYRDRVVSRVRVARGVDGGVDVFMPADGGPTRRPVVVWTHVGTSSPTDALESDTYPHDFAERGYVSASVTNPHDAGTATTSRTQISTA